MTATPTPSGAISATIASGAPPGEIFAEAFANLYSQGVRSVLALLGITIGTASIIAMLSIGNMAQLESLKSFKNMGIDMLQIRAAPVGSGAAGFDRRLVDTLPTDDPDIITAIPLSVSREQVAAGGIATDVAIVAMSPAFATLTRLPLRTGRLIGDADDCGLVIVAGDGAAKKLSAPGAELMPGAKIAIGAYAYTVIGILAPTANESMNPADYNDAVFVPFGCSRRIMAGAAPNTALIRLKPDSDSAAVGERVKARLANASSTLTVVDARALVKAMKAQMGVYTRLLAAIGGVSLLVGGIGVMNVMLMSVMERRREIGLRAAIGATPRDLQLMFLIEAALLALVGGLAGVTLGVGASWFMAKAVGWSFAVALYVLPLGTGMAGIVGMIFGMYPAIMASRVDPIEALRAE
ncbi:ABC transporter permease [Sphingomonas sp. So64.6b]|uniref:ABC transporter permease n=1 Tax=Sphingomonas sp. So64.6b TaxID=2997354 RepID=UPI0016010FC0|nr:ABC transporter permease [Sphingomonas sp. So64.6b]QNA82615.1 ABC transporter permease [Sphingomonas sp. So64.6b]